MIDHIALRVESLAQKLSIQNLLKQKSNRMKTMKSSTKDNRREDRKDRDWSARQLTNTIDKIMGFNGNGH
jgi:hypothetical protein